MKEILYPNKLESVDGATPRIKIVDLDLAEDYYQLFDIKGNYADLKKEDFFSKSDFLGQRKEILNKKYEQVINFFKLDKNIDEIILLPDLDGTFRNGGSSKIVGKKQIQILDCLVSQKMDDLSRHEFTHGILNQLRDELASNLDDSKWLDLLDSVSDNVKRNYLSETVEPTLDDKIALLEEYLVRATDIYMTVQDLGGEDKYVEKVNGLEGGSFSSVSDILSNNEDWKRLSEFYDKLKEYKNKINQGEIIDFREYVQEIL